MAFGGYIEKEVISLTENFQAKSQELMEYLNQAFQNQVFDKMKDAWVCEEAKKFADLAVSDVKSLMDGIEQTNSHNFDVICNEGKSWANNLNSSISLKSWVDNTLRPNDDGVVITTPRGERGYDPDECAQIRNNLQTIKRETEDKLDAIAKSCDNSAFVGGNQQENLKKSIKEVKNKLSSKIDELIEAFDKNIHNTETKYGQLLKSVESSFTAQS